MVEFSQHTLTNGLRVIIHEDHTLPNVVLNVVYDVGARDENENRTGFAHLFEHLMFGGSLNIPVYDEPLQRAGGENNAFTSNDLTNYYVQLPSVNMETAFWLESDRMLGLAFSEKSLEVQRSVVVEEFKQRYLNQPYGTAWLNLRPLAYKIHPYRWPTIGKTVAHIEQAAMEDVKYFFQKHYHPLGAVLVVAGDAVTDDVLTLAEKWFGEIKPGTPYVRALPLEPEQKERREQTVIEPVPVSALYMAFHTAPRKDTTYHSTELIADLLSQGNSSRLYEQLVKQRQVFSEIHAYQTGDLDAGLFVIEGKIAPGFTNKYAEQQVWAELQKLKQIEVTSNELEKVKNKVESTLVFSEMSLLEKAVNLAYFGLSGNAGDINTELIKYQAVTILDIKATASMLFLENKVSVLNYQAE